MPKARTKKKSTPKHPLLGTWVSAEGFPSDVEYIVSSKGDGFAVRALDRQDGEEADVFEIKWDGQILIFAAHWNSTGRFARCRFLAQSPDHVEFTYTYTDHELLHRKSASSDGSSVKH
jgi:hypothetical protein